MSSADLNLWLITTGEPVPLAGASSRLLRTGLVARELRRRGHSVTWWTSRFDHRTKTFLAPTDADEETEDGTRVRFLEGRPYHRNVSLARLRNHREVATDLSRRLVTCATPDAIVCAMPTIELAAVASRWAREYNVPVAVDVRDLWPDIFSLALPRLARPVLTLAVAPLNRTLCAALASATSLYAISEGYMVWALSKARRQRRAGDAVIPLGFARPRSSPEEQEALRSRLTQRGVALNRPMAWFAGSFGHTYDLGPVLEAARLLADTPLQFVIAGAGEYASRWRKRAAGLSNVIFTGWLDERELACLGTHAWVGLAAYRTGAPQGVPNKVIEYLGHGLPVVHSLTGETDRLLSGAGCGERYKPEDPGTLVMLLRRWLAEPDTRNSAAAAADAVFAARFEESYVTGSYANHIVALAASRGRTT